MTESSPTSRREVQIDLSGLSDRQVVARERVLRLGEMCFGPRWQSDFAAALAKEAGRRVGQAQVSHWISGFRPVPEALMEPIKRLAMRLADDMERRVDRIRADWGDDPPQEDVDAAALA